MERLRSLPTKGEIVQKVTLKLVPAEKNQLKHQLEREIEDEDRRRQDILILTFGISRSGKVK